MPPVGAQAGVISARAWTRARIVCSSVRARFECARIRTGDALGSLARGFCRARLDAERAERQDCGGQRPGTPMGVAHVRGYDDANELTHGEELDEGREQRLEEAFHLRGHPTSK